MLVLDELLGGLGGEDDVLQHPVLGDAAGLGLVDDLGLDQGGLHIAGADGVGGDAGPGQLYGEALGEAHHPELGRHIGGLEG
jgi:hypothetical protein